MKAMSLTPVEYLISAGTFLRIGAMFFAIFPWLAGCDSHRTASQVPKVRIGFMATVTHAPAILAVSLRRFDDGFTREGISVETVLFSTGPAVIEALFAGRLDIAYVGPGPAINGFVRSKGQIVTILSGCSTHGVGIVVRSDSDIRRPEDLVGKSIAVPALGNTQYLLATAWLSQLEKRQSSRTLTKLIPCSGSEAEILLRKGQIDAAWLAEPWPTLLEERGVGKWLATENDLWPNRQFPTAIVVARREFVRQNEKLVNIFLRIHRESIRNLLENAEACVPSLAQELKELTKKPIAEATVRRSLQRIKFTDEILQDEIDQIFQLSLRSGLMRRAEVIAPGNLFMRLPEPSWQCCAK